MTEQDQVEFHEQVHVDRGRSLPVRIGIVAGAAVLFIVGVAAAMGAAPSPSTGTDPAAAGASSAPDPSTAADPSAATDPSSAPKGDPSFRGMGPGPGRLFFPGGGFGGFGFGAITVTAVDGSNVSLKTEDGWTRTIAVTDTTKITKGGATIAVGDLKVGDKVRFAQSKNDDGTYTVTAITVVLPTVVGQVSAISGDTITVTQLGGTTQTIHVGSGTTYQIDGTKGSLSDLKVGAFVIAEGTQRTDGSLDAAAVQSGLGGGTGFGPHGFGPGDRGPRNPNASPAPSSGAS